MTDASTITLRTPIIADGPALWRMATDSVTLDVNAPYAYLLWCRDFAATSVIAEADGAPAGFITGYRRPDEPGTLMVWQVAVNAAHRGTGLASRMLDHLMAAGRADGVDHLETTITPDNAASRALFTAFARRWDAALECTELFGADLFGGAHSAEELFRIGPIRTAGAN